MVSEPQTPAPSSSPKGNPPTAGGELDRALLARCKERDPMAFRAFVVRYQRAVFALLSRLLGPGPHVEDLAQEAFLKAFRAFPSFDLDAAARPSTWLLTIAMRTGLDWRKSQRPLVSLEVVPSAAERPLSPSTPESEHRRAEIGRAIARAAAALPDDQRAAFLLAEYHGLSMQELAQALDIPESTAKTRLFRARERLRQLLGELWEESHD